MHVRTGARAALCAAMMAILPSRPAAAQDLVAVAPELARVEYEDARVRVVRLHIPARTEVGMHDRPRRVVVSLTANDVELTRPDGAIRATRTEAGSAAWSEPAVRRVRNLGAPLENIVVELKQAAEPAVALTAPPTTSPGYLEDRYHRWLFENQYVRVYDVRLPPGAVTSFHRHAYDQVAVFVSGGRVTAQPQRRPWGPTETPAARTVSYSADAAAPVTHRVRNDGTADYHVVLVQFLR
jgi:quercetin dioxygenase-like cupin family protein